MFFYNFDLFNTSSLRNKIILLWDLLSTYKGSKLLLLPHPVVLLLPHPVPQSNNCSESTNSGFWTHFGRATFFKMKITPTKSSQKTTKHNKTLLLTY